MKTLLIAVLALALTACASTDDTVVFRKDFATGERVAQSTERSCSKVTLSKRDGPQYATVCEVR